MTGQKHTATGDRLADERSVHAAQSLPKGPETVSLRDELRAVINDLRTEKDKWAGTGAYAPMNAAANRIENTLSLLPPKGWRPIESAPSEDGAEALLWFPDLPEAELQVGRLRWYGDPSDEGSIGIWQDRYTGEDFENARDGMVFPTHFMPLPAAPVTKTVGGGNDRASRDG